MRLQLCDLLKGSEGQIAYQRSEAITSHKLFDMSQSILFYVGENWMSWKLRQVYSWMLSPQRGALRPSKWLRLHIFSTFPWRFYGRIISIILRRIYLSGWSRALIMFPGKSTNGNEIRSKYYKRYFRMRTTPLSLEWVEFVISLHFNFTKHLVCFPRNLRDAN